MPIKPVHPFIARLPFLIAALFFLLAVISVQYDDITFDEPDHLQYGVSILRFKSERHVAGRDFNSTMPVTALNALPRAVEQLFNPGLQKSDWGESDIKNGRYISILVSIALLAYIFLFAKAIAGFAAGCCAMYLAALDPNLLAYGRLVTTDIYGALGFVMTFYHLYRWLADKKQAHFFAWCFAIAIAQCCKVNNILLYPLCIVAIIGWRDAISRKKPWKQLLIFITVQLLIINSLFLFHGTGLSLAGYQFRSTFFQNLQYGFLSQLPLPFPKSYIDIFDLIQYERETFDGIPMNYLLGELRYKQGFPLYYFVSWVLKTPLLTQLLLIISVIILFIRGNIRKQLIFFFLLPAVLSFALLSTSVVQPGYRYLFPVLSMAYVFCGVLIGLWTGGRPRKRQWAFFLLPVFVTISAFPNFIAYTNSLVFEKKYAYRYLADSNINWGQRQKRIEKFLKENPGYIFEPGKPTKGTIVVDLNELVGINDPQKYEWLRKNHKPVATFDNCYLIYQVND